MSARGVLSSVTGFVTREELDDMLRVNRQDLNDMLLRANSARTRQAREERETEREDWETRQQEVVEALQAACASLRLAVVSLESEVAALRAHATYTWTVNVLAFNRSSAPAPLAKPRSKVALDSLRDEAGHYGPFSGVPVVSVLTIATTGWPTNSTLLFKAIDSVKEQGGWPPERTGDYPPFTWNLLSGELGSWSYAASTGGASLTKTNGAPVASEPLYLWLGVQR